MIEGIWNHSSVCVYSQGSCIICDLYANGLEIFKFSKLWAFNVVMDLLKPESWCDGFPYYHISSNLYVFLFYFILSIQAMTLQAVCQADVTGKPSHGITIFLCVPQIA